MSSFEDFVSGTLKEEGFEWVQTNEDGSVDAILNEKTTACLSLFETEAEGDLPAIAMEARAVVDISPEGSEQTLELLLTINRLNHEAWLGRWYYDDSRKTILMEHVLLQEGLNGAELGKTVLAIENEVNSLGQQLVEDLGLGSTDTKVDLRKAWEERKGIA